MRVPSSLSTQHVFVVSDLHLTASDDGKAPTATANRLAAFFRSVCIIAREAPVHIVLNGDTVDFLSGPGASAFIPEGMAARRVLSRIIANNSEIFDALRALLDQPQARLTIILGNHDLELAYLDCQRLLYERLCGAGQGQSGLEFRLGDEALAIGPILIEHGNHYDRWNRVDYGALRRIIYASPRNRDEDEAEPFPLVSGSRLVVEVMNAIIPRLPFVELLKPEDDAVLPLLAVLKPDIINKLQEITNYYKTAIQRDVHRIGTEIADSLGNASVADDEYLAAKQQAEDSFALAYKLTGRGELGNASMGDAFPEFLKIWTIVKSSDQRIEHLSRLLRSLRYLHSLQRHTFHTNFEHDCYVKAACKHIRQGYRYAIFGHTHLPKRIQLLNGRGTYLNTGTWTDVMSLPSAVVEADEKSAFVALASFVDALEEGKTPGRLQLPVFAWIRGMPGQEPTVDLYCYASNEVGQLDITAVRLCDGLVTESTGVHT